MTGRSAPAGVARPPWFTVALAVLCAGLAAVDVGLVIRNRRLQERVDELTEIVAAATRPVLVEGDPLPAVPLLDAAGQPAELEALAAGRPLLLFVSSHACGYCDEVRPVWDQVARASAGTGLDVLELILDGAPGEPRGEAAPYPQWTLVEGGQAFAVRVPGVPAAILVDGAGTVRRILTGEAQAALEAAVEQFLLN